MHEKPDPKKVLEFEDLAEAFGYSLGVEDLAERRITVRHGQRAGRADGGRRQRRDHGRMRQMTLRCRARMKLTSRPDITSGSRKKLQASPKSAFFLT